MGNIEVELILFIEELIDNNEMVVLKIGNSISKEVVGIVGVKSYSLVSVGNSMSKLEIVGSGCGEIFSLMLMVDELIVDVDDMDNIMIPMNIVDTYFYLEKF